MDIENEESMSYQEKRSIAYLISTLLIAGFYFLYVFAMYPEESLNPTTDFSFWGRTILLLFAALVVINIITIIIFNVINYIATRDESACATIEDELDKLIELKASRNSNGIFMIGFMLSVGTLALDMPPYVMFNMFACSIFLSSIVWSCTQFFFYRKGF